MHLLGGYKTTGRGKLAPRLTRINRLRGTRFVTTTEVEEGRKISEPLIKMITGNDKLMARFLYGEFFEFIPTFKIFMATNHKPVINNPALKDEVVV